MAKQVDTAVLADIAGGVHHDPHAVLGPHQGPSGFTVRVYRPMADSVEIETIDGRYAAEHEQDGLWRAVVPTAEVPDYRIRAVYGTDEWVADDPYRFLPLLGELDLHLIREGRHERLWDVLGAHVRRFDSVLGQVEGTGFAVWAPNARAVRVVGDFNHWQGAGHAMRSLGSSGVWELFIPGIGAGTAYKFEILDRNGNWLQKADPLARRAEHPPRTASVVEESHYTWGDSAWLGERADAQAHRSPMSVYEVHLGSWRMGLGYRQLADELVEYVQRLGFTHVEFLPVMEHPFGGSWGYQVSGYYAPTSRFGSPDELRHLIDRLHQAGIGVILDWVPGHFPKDEWALGRFDGTPLYEHADPMRGEQPDWGTFIFDFGRTEVRNFLVANALYWLQEFHVDGLRVDAVASMLYLDYSREEGQWRPNEHGGRENLDAIAFLQEVTATAYRTSPGVTMIAEESTAWPGVTQPTNHGGLGFGLKWNMGWMNDTLRFMGEEPIHRSYHHHSVTFSLMYAFSEQFMLPLSHDEVVHGKGSLVDRLPGDHWQKMAGLRSLLAYQWTHPGKQLLFMGCEFGQYGEWSESRSLDWWHLDDALHSGVQRMVGDLNRLYRETPALYERDSEPGGFQWIDADDSDHNVLSYLRFDSQGGMVAVVVNFAGIPHEDYELALPQAGGWSEVFNSDSDLYGGSGVGNGGYVHATDTPRHGFPASAKLRVPPFGALVLRPAQG
ncbi:1,4-alpha-glucan branching protein GlgB [Demequina pelophila]|uniref:1,4-alpha-glucan branching protein GlgB n=1 Tax=Demequina pelophila TaxID=1638984 RepID=UPI0007833977|nr:1,4-alpha-glucan branching protein GlgB [Demequina pelophila]